MTTNLSRVAKAGWFLGISAFILGALMVLAIRFVNYQPEDQVHYHANFAVYVNGQREKFEGLRYYEETESTACTLEHVESPSQRAHMHGNVNDVVHVEDHLVTWGHFFQNLGWGIGNDYLKTADNIYVPDSQNQLTFMLNGKKVNDDIASRIIKGRDKLLISYGNSSDEQLQQQYSTIPSSARKYDVEKDPAGCSGSQPTTISDRFRHLF